MTAALSVLRDARIAGIRDEASLAAVRRRRSHLGLALLIVLVSLCVATALAPLGPAGGATVDPGALRLGMVGLSAIFVAYAIEKERALSRLQDALVSEQEQNHSIAAEAEQLHRLLSAGHAVTATLELDRVVDLSLAASLRLFDAPGGAVFLDRGDLVLHAVRGDERRLDVSERSARSVAASRLPELVPGPNPGSPVGMAAPLLHDEALLGVILVSGGDTRAFGPTDLETLAAFARHVAAALVNARLYRAAKTTSEHFSGLRDAEQEFSWLAPAP